MQRGKQMIAKVVVFFSSVIDNVRQQRQWRRKPSDLWAHTYAGRTHHIHRSQIIIKSLCVFKSSYHMFISAWPMCVNSFVVDFMTFHFFFSCSDHTVCCIVSGIYCVFLDHLYFFSISSKITSPEMWLFAYSYNFIHIWLRDFVRQLLTWRHLISNNYLRFVGHFYFTRCSEKCDDKTKVWFSLPFMMTKSQYEYTRFTGAL